MLVRNKSPYDYYLKNHTMLLPSGSSITVDDALWTSDDQLARTIETLDHAGYIAVTSPPTGYPRTAAFPDVINIIGDSSGGSSPAGMLPNVSFLTDFDTMDISAFGSYYLKWTSVADRRLANTLTEIPAELGLSNALDGVDDMLLAVEDGTWWMRCRLWIRGTDANYVGELNSDYDSGSTIILPRGYSVGAADFRFQNETVVTLQAGSPGTGKDVRWLLTTQIASVASPYKLRFGILDVVRLA